MTYPMRVMNKPTIILAVALSTLSFAVKAEDKKNEHDSEHMQRHKHMHGANGTGHDEVTMPGLRGKNATAEESEEIAVLFRNFDTISRSVENLENGIKTTTHSTDPTVMSTLTSHVVGMINRVEQKDNPEIFIQSPTLDIFFLRGDQIDSSIEITDAGVVVVQTSAAPEMVTALQEHAAEVSEMADRGMEAVHEMMMMQRADKSKR